MDLEKVILYPLMGEKATMLREKENKLTFIVDKKSTKKDVKEAVEKKYNVAVLSTQIINGPDGKKKAHVKLSDKSSAEEIASHFGIL